MLDLEAARCLLDLGLIIGTVLRPPELYSAKPPLVNEWGWGLTWYARH